MHISVLNLYKVLGLFIECCSWFSADEPSEGAEDLPTLNEDGLTANQSFTFRSSYEFNVRFELEEFGDGLETSLTITFGSYESDSSSEQLLELTCEFDALEDRVAWCVNDVSRERNAKEIIRNRLNLSENILNTLVFTDDQESMLAHQTVERLLKAIVRILKC